MPRQTPRASVEMRGEDGGGLMDLDASQHASQRASRTTARKPEAPVQALKEQTGELIVIERVKMKLQKIAKDLVATVDSQHSYAACAADASRCVAEIAGQLEGYRGATAPIEKELRRLQDAPAKQGNGGGHLGPLSWSRVTAMGTSGMSQGRTVAAHVARRQGGHITIKPQEILQGKLDGLESGEKILSQIKGALPGAVAACRMKSGDVKVTFASTTAKAEVFRVADRTQEKLGARIVRPTYAVEIRGFPTTYPIQHGINADNMGVKGEIERSSRPMFPEGNFPIEQVSWMHGPKTLQSGRGRPTPRSHTSLIVKVGSQDLQKEIVQKGLIMEGIHYEAVVFDSGAVVERCYKCQH